MRNSRWSTLTVLALAQFMVVLDVTIVNVALPDIQARLGFSRRRAAVGGQRLHAAVRRLPAAGRPGGGSARAPAHVLAGLALFTVASLVGRPRDLAGRADRRAGGPGPGRRAAVARGAVDPDRHVRRTGASATSRMGIWGGLAGLGGTLGVVAGGVLVDALGWEWVFFVNVPIGVALLAVTPMFVPESRPAATALVASTPGAVLGTAGMLALVFGVDPGRAARLGLGRGGRAARRRRALLAAFVVVEPRAADPLVPLRLFRSARPAGWRAVALGLNGAGVPGDVLPDRDLPAAGPRRLGAAHRPAVPADGLRGDALPRWPSAAGHADRHPPGPRRRGAC